MGSKGRAKAPTPPNPYATAGAQAQANRDAILTSAAVNRYNEVGPYGSVTWERPQGSAGSGAISPADQNRIRAKGYNTNLPPPSSGDYSAGLGGWTRRTTLSPEMQQQFDQRNQLANQLNQSALNRAGQIDQSAFNVNNLPNVSSYDPNIATGLDTSQMQNVNIPDAQQITSQLPGTPNLPNVPDATLGNDYDNQISQVEQATFDRAMNLMNPEYERRRRDIDTNLIARGLPVGSEAYGDSMGQFDDERNRAMNQAALSSVLAGRNEHSRLAGLDQARFGQEASRFGMGSQRADQLYGMDRQRALDRFGIESGQAAMQAGLRGQQAGEQQASANMANRASMNRIATEESARRRALDERLLQRNQPINELAAILQGSPAIQAPTSAQPAQYQAAPANIQGAINTAYQGALNNYNTNMANQQAKKGGLTGLGGTLGSAAILACDRRLKENIKRLGLYKDYNLYQFNYIGSDETVVGPMADEVKSINPDAIVNFNGYDHVLTGML